MGQRVEIYKIPDSSRRMMYLDMERHIGGRGMVVDYDRLVFDKLSQLADPELPPIISIYTIKLRNGDIIQVPEEMLGPMGDSADLYHQQ